MGYWVHCEFFLSNSVDPLKNFCGLHIFNSGSLWTLFNTFLMQILLKFDEHPASLLFNNLLREKRDPPQSFVVDFLVKTFLLKIMQSTFKFQHPIALKLGSVCVHILTGQAKIQHLGLHHCQILNSSNRKKINSLCKEQKTDPKQTWMKKKIVLFVWHFLLPIMIICILWNVDFNFQLPSSLSRRPPSSLLVIVFQKEEIRCRIVTFRQHWVGPTHTNNKALEKLLG